MSNPSSTASSALPAGSRLGEFEITGVVGEGGFGIVYSARDSSLDRIVAIKEYLPAALAGRNAAGTVQVRSDENSKTFNAGLSSFINEARMLAKFSHPGLVEVFRFWEGNGTAYMAMRYYRGVTLREMLRTNPQVVTEQWLCETLDPILLALQELHQEKCYHRDIAPDNILVLPNGRSVLMDFGAARRIIGGMTRALTTVLKPGYAPIEQYSDDGSMAQGSWTDIYAVGGVLYHAMTGKVPVQAISRMMNDPLKPVATAARGEFSANLCDVVMKCLSVMPENRFQSVDELRTALGWVTTPVSSTVVYAKTSLNAGANFATPTAQPIPASPRVASVASAATVDPLAQLALSQPSAGDALSGLLSVPPSVSAKPAPAVTSRPTPMRPSATQKTADTAIPEPSKRNTLPLIVIGIAALAVVAAGVYLLFAGGAAQPSATLSTPPTSEAKTDTPAVSAPSTSTAPTRVPVAEAPVAAVAPAATDIKGTAVAPTAAAVVAPALDPSANASNTAPAAVVASGTISLDIKPWGNIVVDGISKGASPPMKRLSLPPGTHTIEIQNPAGPTISRTVEVVSGKSLPLRHTF